MPGHLIIWSMFPLSFVGASTCISDTEKDNIYEQKYKTGHMRMKESSSRETDI